jgi:cytochrome P450
MTIKAITPRRLDKWQSFVSLMAIVNDPLVVMRRLHDSYGPFVELQYPHSSHRRPRVLGCIADARLYQAIVSDHETWRTVNFAYRGFKHHASRRLNAGMQRYRGRRLAHYRRLFAPPLSRLAVLAMSTEMATIAKKQVSLWRRDTAIDLIPVASHLMQDLAIGLLFGDDRARARPITALMERQLSSAWPSRIFNYLAWLTVASKQERLIMEWAEQKRGNLDPKDIISIVVNNPDEYGAPATRDIISGLVNFTFAAAYETCQNAVTWTLILLAQHPQVAAAVADEIREAIGHDLPTMDRIGSLPLLDGVMKEGMRLFPPVPITGRKSTTDTTLGGVAVKSGTRYLANNYLINRNPDIYSEPDCFRPERWSRLNPSPLDYTVFGAGGRMCPGVVFAGQMVKIVLAAILSQHRVDMVSDAHIDYRINVTLMPYPAVPVILRDVSDAPAATRITGRFRDLIQLPAPE